MIHRLLPLSLILIALITVVFNLNDIRREFAYNSYTKSLAVRLGINDDTTNSCCDEQKIAASSGDFDESAAVAIFNNKIIDYPKTSLAYSLKKNTQVLGTSTPVDPNKWIEVDLAKQLVRAWEGTRLAMEFPISSGKWAPTPIGEFKIWYKTRSQSMIGGSKDLGTYYNLSNVPHNMFFYRGYALHGAYWHNDFGQPMSHGCVNEPLANASQIFDWAGPVLPEGKNAILATNDNPGTRVIVHD